MTSSPPISPATLILVAAAALFCFVCVVMGGGLDGLVVAAILTSLLFALLVPVPALRLAGHAGHATFVALFLGLSLLLTICYALWKAGESHGRRRGEPSRAVLLRTTQGTRAGGVVSRE